MIDATLLPTNMMLQTKRSPAFSTWRARKSRVGNMVAFLSLTGENKDRGYACWSKRQYCWWQWQLWFVSNKKILRGANLEHRDKEMQDIMHSSFPEKVRLYCFEFRWDASDGYVGTILSPREMHISCMGRLQAKRKYWWRNWREPGSELWRLLSTIHKVENRKVCIGASWVQNAQLEQLLLDSAPMV